MIGSKLTNYNIQLNNTISLNSQEIYLSFKKSLFFPITFLEALGCNPYISYLRDSSLIFWWLKPGVAIIGSDGLDRIGKIDPIQFFWEGYRSDPIFLSWLPIRSNFFETVTDPIRSDPNFSKTDQIGLKYIVSSYSVVIF